MLSSEYYKLKSFNMLQALLDAYHKVFMDYVTLMKSHAFGGNVYDVPAVLFHHLERTCQEMQSAYNILYNAVNDMYVKVSGIEIKDEEDLKFSTTIGEWEQDRRLKSLSKMKQFMDACNEELKLLQAMKKGEQIAIEHKVVQSNMETSK